MRYHVLKILIGLTLVRPSGGDVLGPVWSVLGGL
jgi:hypothetical protein